MIVSRMIFIAVSAVGAVFAIRVNFLESISPPGGIISRIAEGASYIISVIIYLAMLAFKTQSSNTDGVKSQQWTKIFIVSSSIALIGLVTYVVLFVYWTTDELGEYRQIKGEYIQTVQEWINKYSSGTDPGPAEIMKKFPDAEGNIFIKSSIDYRRLTLILFYVLTVTGLCSTIFSLCEKIGSNKMNIRTRRLK